MGDPLSRSAIDRLGDRLRAEVSDEDLGLLQEVRMAHDEVLRSVVTDLQQISLRGAPLQPTSRLKTVGTIIDKLWREPHMRLSQMEDIAGVRLVIDGSRLHQKILVKLLEGDFAPAKLRDRLENPSYGYRALHVIVRRDGCLVEVQVRTPLQDLWAQVIERLSDAWDAGSATAIRRRIPTPRLDRRLA